MWSFSEDKNLLGSLWLHQRWQCLWNKTHTNLFSSKCLPQAEDVVRGKKFLFCKTLEIVLLGSMWRKQKLLKTVLLLHIAVETKQQQTKHEKLQCPGIKLQLHSCICEMKFSPVGFLLYSSFFFIFQLQR